MLFFKAHADVAAYVDQVDQELRGKGRTGMTRLQRRWLGFCITGVVVTGTFLWSRLERASAGSYSARALGFMFKWAQIPWQTLFAASMLLVIKSYGLTEGDLVIDDTERRRSKRTKKLWGVHKMKDKKTNGYIMGQELVILVLVTKIITMPVGFEFYRPDPAQRAWKENDDDLKERGIKRALRPAKPARDKKYPTKQGLGMRLLRRFRYFTASSFDVASVLADAAYMSRYWVIECGKVFPKAQIISQLRSNQIVRAGSKPEVSLLEYFKSARSQEVEISLRGLPPRKVTMASARLFVRSLGRKILVVALKYEGEDEYRYLAATNLTWRSLDVVRRYANRWLIEVFNQDWKVYGGWGKAACQQGEDGARQGVYLSLLLDHFLLVHPVQLRLGLAAQPLLTAGSLHRKLQIQSLLSSIEQVLEGEDPKANLKVFASKLEALVELRPSDKHLSGKVIEPLAGRPEPDQPLADTG